MERYNLFHLKLKLILYVRNDIVTIKIFCKIFDFKLKFLFRGVAFSSQVGGLRILRLFAFGPRPPSHSLSFQNAQYSRNETGNETIPRAAKFVRTVNISSQFENFIRKLKLKN